VESFNNKSVLYLNLNSNNPSPNNKDSSICLLPNLSHKLMYLKEIKILLKPYKLFNISPKPSRFWPVSSVASLIKIFFNNLLIKNKILSLGGLGHRKMVFTLNMDSNLCIPLIKAPEKSQCMLMNSNDSLIITNLIPQITIFKEIVSAMDRVNLSLDLKVA
jgi:hypothetical protein